MRQVFFIGFLSLIISIGRPGCAEAVSAEIRVSAVVPEQRLVMVNRDNQIEQIVSNTTSKFVEPVAQSVDSGQRVYISTKIAQEFIEISDVHDVYRVGVVYRLDTRIMKLFAFSPDFDNDGR